MQLIIMQNIEDIKIAFFISILGLLLLIIFLTSNTAGDSESSRNIVALEEDGCESCHGEFYPFEVEVTMPKETQVGENFEFKIVVRNTDGDTQHTVTDLDASLTGIAGEPKEPYTDEHSNSITRFSIDSYSFPVMAGASIVDITLTGNDGAVGLNNIDLILTSPNNVEWSSESNNADEGLTLNADDIVEGGFGSYDIDINYVNGIGPISYTVFIEVTYSSTNLFQSGDDLDYGESYEFNWDLILTENEMDSLAGTVSGTVSFEHDGGHLETTRYQVQVTSDLINSQGTSGISINYNLSYGRVMGLFSLLLLGGVFITSASERSRTLVAQKLNMKNPRRVHCYLALSILLFAIIHSALLLRSNYTLSSSPSILGTTAFFLFIGMTFEGFNRDKIVKKIGKPRWKLLHISLALAITLIVLYHAVVYGSHFLE